MDFYHILARFGRWVMAALLLFSTLIYVQESLFETKIMDVANKLNAEFSFSLDDVGIKIAVSESTFKFEFNA